MSNGLYFGIGIFILATYFYSRDKKPAWLWISGFGAGGSLVLLFVAIWWQGIAPYLSF